MNNRHVIYGVFFHRKLIYVGCTKHFPNRLAALFREHSVLRVLAGRLKARIIATAKDRQAGFQIETRIIERRLAIGKFMLNECPSTTLTWASKKRKAIWTRHWRKIGSRMAGHFHRKKKLANQAIALRARAINRNRKTK